MCHIVEKFADIMNIPYPQLDDSATLRTYGAVDGELYHTDFIPIGDDVCVKTFAIAKDVINGAVKEVASLASLWNVRFRFVHGKLDGDDCVIFETTHFVLNEDKWDVDAVEGILYEARLEVQTCVSAVFSILYEAYTAEEAFEAYQW